MEDQQKIPVATINQLCDMNFEIRSFLNKFAIFRQTNVVDNALCENFAKLVEEIETYMDSNPKRIPSPELSRFDIDLEENHLARVLFCDICEMEIRNQVHFIAKHLASNRHCASMESMKENQLPKGQMNAADRKQSRREKSLKIPVHKTLPKKMSNFVKSNYFDYVTKTATTATALKHIPEYDLIRKSLREQLCDKYPNIKIHFFGSRINGLSNPDSDLDIYIDIGDLYNKLLDTNEAQKYVKSIRAILEKYKTEWNTFTSVLSARTPILRVNNHKHRIDCDISFSSLGQCNTFLIKYLIELQPICRLICLFVKKWFSLTSFSDSISSYALILMVVFHLQQQNYLPAVFVLQRCVEPTYVGPWQGNFAQLPLSNFQMKLIPITPQNLTQQLLSFFNFIADVDYAKYMICTYTGTLVERAKFDGLTEIFTQYHAHRKELTKKDRRGILEKPAIVQDPLDHNHNVAKGITARLLAIFTQDCRLTAAQLSGHAQKS